MSKKRILHVLSQRPDSTGSGIYIQAMIKEAVAAGYNNFLVAGISPGHQLDTGFIHSDNCRLLTFESTEVDYKIPGMSDIMPYDSSKFCDLSPFQLKDYRSAFSKILENAAAEFQPDIIHTHHLWIVTTLVRQLFPNIPVVASSHGSDLRQFRNCNHLQTEVASVCRNLNRVFALTTVQKDEICQLYGIGEDKIVVTGAGFNDKLFYKIDKKTSRKIRLIYAGKLSNSKGVPWMLEALKSIDEFDWHLDLVGGGSGEEREKCLSLADKLGNRVTVHGAIPQNKLAELFRKSDIFILPSFYEGVPLVVLEAIACGCRVVVTNLPGVKELLQGQNFSEIGLVDLPELKNIDQPVEGDEKDFITKLKSTIESQMNKHISITDFKISTELQDLLNRHTWGGIFAKVEKQYLEVLKEKFDNETNA